MGYNPSLSIYKVSNFGHTRSSKVDINRDGRNIQTHFWPGHMKISNNFKDVKGLRDDNIKTDYRDVELNVSDFRKQAMADLWK